MSTMKHNCYRTILNVQRYTTKLGDIIVPCKTVVWCIVESRTSRTIETKDLRFTTYVGSFKFNGINAKYFRKSVSINLKNPMQSKCLESINVQAGIQDSFNDAYRQYVLGSDSRSKNLNGTVMWFSHDKGMIKDTISGQLYSVYACNIQGAKTWFENTACMYLKEGETVQYDLADMGTHLTPSKVRGNVYFDAEKWNSLDQSKLAFKCDENGKVINGLFE